MRGDDGDDENEFWFWFWESVDRAGYRANIPFVPYRWWVRFFAWTSYHQDKHVPWRLQNDEPRDMPRLRKLLTEPSILERDND